jgi:hypothetical protein
VGVSVSETATDASGAACEFMANEFASVGGGNKVAKKRGRLVERELGQV